MNWWSILKAYYSTNLKQEDVATWEYLLSKKDVSAEELCEVIQQAADHGMKSRGYQATVKDVEWWIDKSRNDWPTYTIN